MVYLDYNATTPLAPEVVEEITQTLTEAWGNPSSSYSAGLKATTAIARARKHVSSMISAHPSDIVFTSGGTEGNNWILKTGLESFSEQICADSQCHGDMPANSVLGMPHFITSNIEHDSIKLVLENFQAKGWAEVSFLPVRLSSGSIDPDDVIAAVRPNTIMVTIMMANNETGIIQPIRKICEGIKSLKRQEGETRKIFVHTDAAQALGKICVDVRELGVDYLTIVGHKFYAPRIGAVFVHDLANDTPLHPLFFGGGQERNFRPGTENTPMIAGLGKAAELVYNNLDVYHQQMKETRDYLESRLTECFGDSISFNGRFDASERLPNTCNVSFVGMELKGHEILSMAPMVQASVGAACHNQNRASHILLAIGVPTAVAWKALRISVGRETTKDDVDLAVKELRTVFEH